MLFTEYGRSTYGFLVAAGRLGRPWDARAVLRVQRTVRGTLRGIRLEDGDTGRTSSILGRRF